MSIKLTTPASGNRIAVRELNALMASNWGLRHQYLVTYGCAWQALPEHVSADVASRPAPKASPATLVNTMRADIVTTAELDAYLTGLNRRAA